MMHFCIYIKRNIDAVAISNPGQEGSVSAIKEKVEKRMRCYLLLEALLYDSIPRA